MVKQHIEHMNNVSEYVHLDKYIIMPNHIHLIIDSEGGKALRNMVCKIKTVSVNRCKTILNGKPLWQRNYYEHVIRDERDYARVADYIVSNPLRWTEDEYYS